MLTLKAPIDLVTAHTSCWKCHTLTPVSSLRVRELRDVEGEFNIQDARVLNAKSLPEQVIKAAAALNPGFRLGASKTAGSYVANHCASCGAIQGDFFLNSEPEGPFFCGQIPSDAVTDRLLDAGEYEADASYAY